MKNPGFCSTTCIFDNSLGNVLFSRYRADHKSPMDKRNALTGANI